MDARYPKAKYHVSGQTFVVYSQEEDDAQDPRQWFDHPDKAKAGPSPLPKPETKREVRKPYLKIQMEDLKVDDGK